MNINNLIKVIYLVSALFNLSQPGKASQSFDIENKKNSSINNFLTKKVVSEKKKLSEQNSLKNFRKDSITNSKSNNFKTFRKNSQTFLAILSNRKRELNIQSKIQSEENNILNAKGNVVVSYKGNILKADSLIYDKREKTIFAKGNVSLNIGDQLFTMKSLKYNFNNKKGYLLDVKGLIKTDNLIDDLFYNFENSDVKKNKILNEIKKDKVKYTAEKVGNWIFFTDKIQVNENKWKSVKAIFTNDLLELKQVKIEVNSLEAIASKQELRFKSAVNFLILDEKFHIPFWFGNRTLTKEISYANRWNVGFENIDRDGFYIGRQLSSINLPHDFTLDLEPQFLIQRSLKGNTKSFVNKGDSITGDKVQRDASLKDYFALNSQVKGEIDNWNLEIDKQINSFDPEKFSNAIRFYTNLSRDITFLDSKWNKSFYGIYRNSIWNGSIGETEIYGGYGSKLEKQNSWVVNGINKNEVFSLGLGNFKGEALNSKNLVSTIKGNFFYTLDQKFPITVDERTDTFVDSSYKYISQPIKKGISLNTRTELHYSSYGSGDSQQYIGIGAGPEFVFGDFKRKSFDYTRIRLLPFLKIKSGDSLFKFDQISDKFTLDIDFDQQLFGPLILKNSATLKVSRSKDYADFINSKISLNWKKRSYELGIFYQPHNEAGGINFSLFGFE